MADIDITRAKKLGELIKDAREFAERTPSECAQILNISASEFEKVEAGEQSITLPDLEALAMFLRVPMGYFWGKDQLERPEEEINYPGLIALRHRVIGALLRQLRLQARYSVAEIAESAGIEEAELTEYESGMTPVPYFQLEKLCRALDVPITHFLDDHRGPLGRHEMEQRLQRIFRRMSPEMQTFVSSPVNVSYLETAERLSKMDSDKLRQIAESLLDITF